MAAVVKEGDSSRRNHTSGTSPPLPPASESYWGSVSSARIMSPVCELSAHFEKAASLKSREEEGSSEEMGRV
ncbi:hypothetical protein SKAU_G00014250 [Synaphobranchus kaupii]|uniref:Uncharacterized protein n=1 Tax=Synaphobranchus kaupii TaxID=118154 RepID=A0A9Q1GAU7_SYNKA|nr:hypothetical protein SKAU_G00014250 [Synaphobranchus kaupii]